MLKPLALTLILSASSTNAEIYQWTDTNGQKHYSDQVPATGKTKDGIHTTALPTIITMTPTPILARPTTPTQPRVIYLSGDTSQAGCSTHENGNIPNNKVWDAWQEQVWKNCHGMK